MDQEEKEIVKKLMRYTGKTAYPTIILFFVVIIGFITTFVAGLLGWISYGWVIAINTVFIYLIFTPLHEASHRNIKGKRSSLKWLEDGIGWISGTVLLAPYTMFRHLHNIHHGHTNDPTVDPDYWVSSRNPFMVFFKCMTIYFDYLYHYVGSISGLMKSREGKRNVIVTIVGYLGLISITVVLGTFISWKAVLFGWLLPSYLALGFLAFAFDWLPHHPHSVQKKYLDTRIILSPVLNVLLVSQNLHLIHHLYSGIPYYYYQNAYDILEDKLQKEGASISK